MSKVLSLVLVICLLSLSGCAWIMPNVDKARTERRQEELLERQCEAIERIADVLEQEAEQP